MFGLLVVVVVVKIFGVFFLLLFLLLGDTDCFVELPVFNLAFVAAVGDEATGASFGSDTGAAGVVALARGRGGTPCVVSAVLVGGDVSFWRRCFLRFWVEDELVELVSKIVVHEMRDAVEG